jgi:protoporphyrinogen oxidase
MAARHGGRVDADHVDAPRLPAMPRVTDAIVLGAGPAGLGAALALTRAGASVTLVDAADRPGGLCVTRHRDGMGYDVGGHIPFVRDAGRRAWLRDLLGDDLRWVPLPVRSVRDGRVRPGRYLDQPAAGPVEVLPDDGSALAELSRRVGTSTVEREMRAYLEKIDGVPLERIPGERARRLLEDQAAPDGFHFPAHGIGQLMDAMAAAAVEGGATLMTGTRVEEILIPGGRVAGARVSGPGGPLELSAARVVVALPAGMAVRMFRPLPPPETVHPVRMRAVCIAYLEATPAQAFADAWVQVDDPAVPFARMFVPGNWSADLVPGERSLFGCECYCQADDDDPVWGLTDSELSDACARALVSRLGWIAPSATVRPVEVVRLPRAYPLPDRAQMEAVQAPARWIAGIDGVEHAPGAAVIEAIENGERAAERAMGALAGVTG